MKTCNWKHFLSMSTIYIFQNIVKSPTWKSWKKSPNFNFRFKSNLVFEALQKILGGACCPTPVHTKVSNLAVCLVKIQLECNLIVGGLRTK